MALVTVTLGTLIDRALSELRGPHDKGLRVVLSGSLTDSATTFSLVDGSAVNVSDLIEFGSELMLVTAKTADVVPVFTVARGYYGTTAAAQSASAVGEVNPPYPRIRLADAVRRSFARLEALGLPLVTTSTFNRVTDKRHVLLGESVREVLRVSHLDEETGEWIDLDKWSHVTNVTTSIASGGNLLAIPRYVQDEDDLEVTYRTPYRWSTHPSVPVEASTISLREGTEDLPAMYAAAWMVGAREISRQQLDKSTEWNQGEPARGGISMSLVRLKWQQFYAAIDEARRLDPVPIHRPYVRQPRVVRSWSS
jgi:hypothetical protein